ncbi:hypothetical protein PQO01_14435 [Lentisphaera marina]|uniref:hypothetical protein n=1 Tax=Lentisphaera marina TaxID=1111041 RepID=UPI0023670CCB|nr:hypothetical protein [Lentisphaera marina]MDD7986146.1 hypothetical protein [Lentisphaera marina]
MKYLFTLLFVLNFSLIAGLQPITAKDGVLYYADGKEVNLWGVNFQPSLSFEHAARMENQNLLMPLRVEDLKSVTDESFDEVQLIGSELIRIHLDPADYSDEKGNLVETIWLDILDYTMAESEKRGVYVYLTFLNHLAHEGSQHLGPKDSYIKAPREDWMFEDHLINAGKNNVRQLLNRRNPYNGLLYKEHTSLGLVEPINEPAFVWYEKWLQKNPGQSKKNFSDYRYKATLKYLNEMVELFREEGLKIPVIWNSNWPKMIRNHKDVFQAIADSKVDGVSFCNYPGQDDLKAPFWKYPKCLDENNYLPYLQQCFDEWDYLGWVKDERFKKKAKVVYEYETMFNQTGYMYPAMAKVFRALGVQVAAQWTYGLTSYITHQGGSHVFNLKSMPSKTASFMVAGEVFKQEVRGGVYKTDSNKGHKEANVLFSFSDKLSASYKDGVLTYSNNLESALVPKDEWPTKIFGLGNSEFVNYSGNGLYILEEQGNIIRLTVYPDREYVNPHWKELHTGEEVMKLHSNRMNQMSLKLRNPEAQYRVFKKVAYRWETMTFAKTVNSLNLRLNAGEYLIEKL